jgi:hypothetical protein
MSCRVHAMARITTLVFVMLVGWCSGELTCRYACCCGLVVPAVVVVKRGGGGWGCVNEWERGCRGCCVLRVSVWL